ncbi:MAG: hypothetical protein KAR47_20650, partial [Planctomycetes bacterium]|nr:hypothetical protein [Planctomycetota bacterium]
LGEGGRQVADVPAFADKTETFCDHTPKRPFYQRQNLFSQQKNKKTPHYMLCIAQTAQLTI